ncbi:MAG: hypothetical protein RQ751_10800 [Longimicrobiales bacterium]|nr:hypothetical protein [Longimicrobiales bacterium]
MHTKHSIWIVALAAAGCMSTGYKGVPATPVDQLRAGAEPAARVSVDAERKEIEVLIGPFDVPATEPGMDHHAMDHSAHEEMYSPMAVFRWPVDPGLKGFRLAAYSADGTRLPRDLFHHVIGVNFGRRQLVYPVAERLFGFGTETPDVKLPGALEVPVARGDSIGVYAMWKNETGVPLHDVYMQIILPYAEGDRMGEAALPVYFDTNNNIGGKTSFDLPPGRYAEAFEFEVPVGGGLLAASGHLHDHGQELRLENAETGEVLFRLLPERDAQGRVVAVEQRIFRRFFKLMDARVRLEPGVRYRVVGVYDNPTGEVIPDGGMAHVVGLFVPDDLNRWPALDPNDRFFQEDAGALPPVLGAPEHDHSGHAGHSGGSGAATSSGSRPPAG